MRPTVPAEVSDTTGQNGDHRHAGQDEDVRLTTARNHKRTDKPLTTKRRSEPETHYLHRAAIPDGQLDLGCSIFTEQRSQMDNSNLAALSSQSSDSRWTTRPWLLIFTEQRFQMDTSTLHIRVKYWIIFMA